MDPTTVNWFISIAALSSLAWAGGYYLGKRSVSVARSAVLVGLTCLIVWSWLHYHPSVAVRVIPLAILTRIEGVGSVPIFMFLLGLAWSRARVPRQKRVITWAIMFGWVFFLNGALWMIQSTPDQSFANTVTDEPVMQSQEYSCVAASCAEALNQLGVPTSEEQMAKLTQTRPGTGSTMLRAMLGLRERLAGSPFDVELLEVPPDEMHHMPGPMLTPLQFEQTRLHMVTILSTNVSTVRIADPTNGVMNVTWSTFEELYGGQVLIFVDRQEAGARRSRPASD